VRKIGNEGKLNRGTETRDRSWRVLTSLVSSPGRETWHINGRNENEPGIRRFAIEVHLMAGTDPTFRAFVTRFTDFLAVAIHTILYERSIYPETSFLSARKYNFAVRQNRHPKVCEWINDAVAAVETELLKGTVARVAVVIYDKSNKPLERFMFDVSRFPIVPASEIDTPLEAADEEGERSSVLPIVDMEEQFRATMSKLSGCGATLKALPKGCTYTIAIELKGDGEPPIGHPQPWMPIQPDVQNAEPSKSRNTTVPVRAVAAGDMVFEVWIEQTSVERDDG
jgi:mitotic spindle assembly checkpoint protein MAD2B